MIAKVAKLANRKLLQIQTTSPSFDISSFLNSMVTNKVAEKIQKSSADPPLLPTNPKLFSAAFLSPQGRVLMDSMIYYNKDIAENGYLIEVESSMMSTLQSHLKRYILRSPIKMKERDDLEVLHSWSNHGEEILHTLPNASPSFKDPRSELMGFRQIANKDNKIEIENLVNEDEYLIHRIHVGIGEGPNDFIYNSSLPLELNLDLAHGVDFKKGCYLGQELTHRTKHLGVVRKRLTRLLAVPSDHPRHTFHYIPSKTSILANTPLFLVKDRDKAKRKTVGRTGSWIGNIGLGIVKLEHVANLDSFKQSHLEEHMLETECGTTQFLACSSSIVHV